MIRALKSHRHLPSVAQSRWGRVDSAMHCSNAAPPANAAASSSWCMVLRPTRRNLLPIPPAAWRLLSVGVLFLVDAFLRAHRKEVNQAAAGTSSASFHTRASAAIEPMQRVEALQILGLPDTLTVPLKGSHRQQAEQNFRRYFEKAEQANSPYLQGKFSAAYRLCVDKEWDQNVNDVDGVHGEATQTTTTGAGASTTTTSTRQP